MCKSIVSAMALVLALGGARAGAQPAPADAEPELHVRRFAGDIEVKMPSRQKAVSGGKMSSLDSGSIVRVLSDSAVFESDVHATVRAGKGDVFYFATFKPEEGRPGSLRIAAIETEPKALEVAVGGERFRLSKGGGLSVAAAGSGKVAVKSEWGDVRIASSGRSMASGEEILIPVSDERADAERLARGEEARRVVSLWPEASRTVAEALLEKYGPPVKVGIDRLSWDDNGAWKKTTVYRVPIAWRDVLEQTISYDVPQDKHAALSQLDIALQVNQIDNELSATSESEETNFLAMNLADEVVQEKKTPEDARDFYLKTVRLSGSGKSSPYMQGLLFRP